MPRLAHDPGYLQRMGFETYYFHGQLMVRQPPGEKNALGRIKFMFPNQYSVYLHDTPEKRFFASTKRAFSHGCVRVDQPLDFAQTVLGPKWPQDRIESLIGGKERYVFLPKPLPIHIEYFTAYVSDDDRLIVRNDVYGYEHKIEEALGLVAAKPTNRNVAAQFVPSRY
ncbi:MAG TPA: L,D-transpeptidase family protein [Methylovirgula sp.]